MGQRKDLAERPGAWLSDRRRESDLRARQRLHWPADYATTETAGAKSLQRLEHELAGKLLADHRACDLLPGRVHQPDRDGNESIYKQWRENHYHRLSRRDQSPDQTR